MSYVGPFTQLYWCPTCGVVGAADEPPVCRHFIPPSLAHPPARMEPLPSWHPYAEDAA